jgi:hypothetical protein
MVLHDLQSFARAVGGDGQSILGALDVQFGVPTCMMNLGKDLLSLLPSNVLGGMRNDMQIGRNAADAVTKALSQKLRNLTGIIEFDTDEGVFRFVSDASQLGQEFQSNVAALGSWLGAAQQSIAFGSRLYSNLEAQVTSVEELIACLSGAEKYQKFIGGESGLFKSVLAANNPEELDSLITSQLGPEIQNARNAEKFIQNATDTISDIDDILTSRIENPDLEPIIGEPLPDPDSDPDSVFRLNAGPPESKGGQFILSVDGLYYDSQTSGTAPALLELSNRDGERDPSLDWTFRYDPNLGGKGIPTNSEGLNTYFNTIFDPNIIDDSPFLQKYYDADNTLVNIIGQRNRKVYDVSAELQEHQDAGSSQVIIDNLKRVMISESARFMGQAKRRQKQIELAVKLPSIYGKGQLYAPGEVPVNDFSYLAGVNYALDIQKQRSLIIRQDEVKSVVLPVETKFSQPIQRPDDITIDHLLIGAVPDGVIIDSAAASASVSASIAATPRIVEDGLFGLYNYLTLKTSDPSSTVYGLRNSTANGVSHNAQLVGAASEILDKGLGVAHLKGVCKTDSLGFVSGNGTFAKLPPQQEFQDLIFGRNGATFESWVYTPDLSSTNAYNQTPDVSGLYRLILANENTGSGIGINSQPNILDMSLDNGIGVTRGMIFGFSRDRRFTRSAAPSNLEADNPVHDVALVLAPTQSYDSSSAGFLVNKLTTESCESVSSYKGLVIPVSSTYNGATLSSCTTSFCQISMSLNPVRDEIKVYLDGTLLVTSNYMDVFGVPSRKQTPMIPSIPPDNAFEYNTQNITGSSLEAYKYGPKRDEYFTPWILGGGYTDGNPDGGFMGGSFGGKVSGLAGYLGCTRFYSKPLNSSEILNNYNATRNFFKNIKL